MKNNFIAKICAFVAIIGLGAVLLFNYHGTWDVFPKNYKKYFQIAGFGTVALLILVAIFFKIKSYFQKNKNNVPIWHKEEGCWMDDFHHPGFY